MSRESLERVPAVAAAAALHVGVIVLALMLGQWLNKPEQIGNVTTVTLMTSADVAAAREAMQAEQQQEASTPTPSPQAPEPAPAPTPTPAPPQPLPTPAKSSPAPTPQAQATPAAKGTTKPAKPTPAWDPVALSQSLLANARASGGKPSSAPTGPPKQRTTVKVQTSSGVSTVASNAAGVALGEALGRLWIRNCGVMGGSNTTIVVSYKVGPGGRLIGTPVSSEANTSDPLVKVASDRAIRAVYAYFSDPPPEAANLTPDNYKSPFNPKQDCPQ